MTRIAIVSFSSPRTPEMTAAAISTITIVSLNWSIKMASGPRCLAFFQLVAAVLRYAGAWTCSSVKPWSG